VAWVPCANAYYRAIYPVKAMERRGHQIVAPPDGQGAVDPHRLLGCDVVHIYRRCDEPTRRVLAELVRNGTPLTYDNDDDFTAVPKEAPEYRKLGGLEGQRGFARSVRAAKLASVFTTTNERLAEKYRRAGVERTEAIGNYLAPEALRPRHRHDDVVIGWVAGGEHRADVARIPIAGALERLIADHHNVRVECIGVDLRLPERYRHDAELHFRELPDRIGGFDIGIAPLADIPMNRMRSDIKLKEYAASGVPWLASPVGPYVGMGEGQGGRLVSDDGWFEALDELVTNELERERLAGNAAAWARSQTIEAVADRWEKVFATAAGHGPADPSGPGFAPGRRVTVRLVPPRR
jgi:glycosyltransferase involved in cell wall biosynthesis